MFRANRYPKDWKQIRTSILERARNACEQCRAPNRTVIARGAKGSPAEGTYMLEDGTVRNEVTGQDLGLARGSEYDVDRFVEVILTVAHVDHDERNNDPSNLRALCQRCHLALDRADNARRRRAGARAGCAVAELPLDSGPADHDHRDTLRVWRATGWLREEE